MKFIVIIFFIIFLVVFLFDLLTRRYKSPYVFNLFIGSPGCGKSTMYTMFAHYYLSRGHHVYGTDPVEVEIKDKKTRKKTIVSVKKIEARDLYSYKFPPDSVILIDEIGTIFHNRAWKEFSKKNVLFWKHFRHCHLIIYAWSQSFDVDLTLRNLVTQFWIQEKKMRVFSIARRLIMKPVVVHPQGEGVARITDDFVEDPKLLKPVIGGMKVVFIPRWVKNFDSYCIPEEMAKNMVTDYSDDPIPYLPTYVYSVKHEKRRMRRNAFIAKWRERLERARQAYYVVRATLAFYAVRIRKKLRRSK